MLCLPGCSTVLSSKLVLLLTTCYANCKVEHERLAAASMKMQQDEKLGQK
jgi:hypothetical protein